MNTEREKFEKAMLDSGCVMGNISAFWNDEIQNYDIAITELRMAWKAWQAAKADLSAEQLQRGRLFNEQVDKITDLEHKLKNAVPEKLENDCMIGQTWFMKGTPTKALIKHTEDIYKSEVVAQNSKIEFGTDDNEHWFAHDVPFYGRVQISKFVDGHLEEWDIYFNECWQGPFNSKSECIKHLEECIAEQREEAQEQGNV